MFGVKIVFGNGEVMYPVLRARPSRTAAARATSTSRQHALHRARRVPVRGPPRQREARVSSEAATSPAAELARSVGAA